MSSIKLITDVPGPKSGALVQRRAAAVSAGAAYLTELGIATGEGSVIVDLDGNHLLDFAGGIGVLGTGHCPPEVTAAIQRQSAELIHMCAIVASYEPLVELAELLNAVVPGEAPHKTLLMNSGAEAKEGSFQRPRRISRRYGVSAITTAS